MDFAGPLTFREHKDDYYILVTVGRLKRYPHAQVYKNCDTETALKYLEEYCNFHGTPVLQDVTKHKLLKRGNSNYIVKIKISN